MANKFMDSRTKDILRVITPYLKIGDRIIDIGSGDCTVAKNLRKKGYKITPLDVKDKSVHQNIRPTIYDGQSMPFPDNSFDVALLITVLHHTKKPVEVLRETLRVAPRIIVMEDLYESIFQKYLTFIMDSLLNLEFFGHPHTNMTERQWEGVFKKLGLKIIDRNIHNFWRFFISGTFYLEKVK
ncbi:MAG: class I SAM-dependent methyltransferase [Candidatus Colwellbacteria bacterium]|nr:class I SAM-dependent methyltransferase [Candidatus Colwellbacteria bacterium]